MRSNLRLIPYLLLAPLFFLSTGLFSGLSQANIAQVAMIVNKENPTVDISQKDLVKILKQDKQYWDHGSKTYLILQESRSAEKKIVLEKLYQMNDEELKRFWLSKIFRGEIASFPKTLASNEAVKRFVARVPNAIGFVDASSVDESVKALRIDGKLPSDSGYPLSQ